MRTLIYIIVVFLVISCKTGDVISVDLVTSDNEKIVKFIKRDSVFKKDISTYYYKLNECEKINFFKSSVVKPISISYFDKNSLAQTNYFKQYEGLDEFDFNKVKNEFDTKNEFSSYVKGGSNEIKNDCNVELLFSKRTENIMIIEYEIKDYYVDERIDYIPNKGYYLVEFDNDNSIKQRFYVLKRN